MPPALATCRIQLRNGLDFDGLTERLDYLDALGITHLYLSPIFTAARDSTHGYDCVDPNTIDPVLGGEAGFKRLCDALRSKQMGLLLDIVPNHLGIDAGNRYWYGLQRDGPASEYAKMFDVDWQSIAGGTPGKLMLPILGSPVSEALEKGQLSVTANGEPLLQYFEHQFPLAVGSQSGSVEQTLAKQNWQLIWWRSGNRLLNWRRFFDITTLAGVRVEDPEVFELVHSKIFELLNIDVVQGLRIDHIDGLANPHQYLQRLDQAWRARRTDQPWILIEKILAAHEKLPDSWPTDGTTGYETLNRLTSVFIHPAGITELKKLWSANGQRPESFDAELAAAKREILSVNLAAELNRLALEICRLEAIDFTPELVAEALIRLIVATDCYRSYGSEHPQAFDRAIAAMDRSTLPAALPAALVAAMPPGGNLRQRFEQLSAPAMAKSLEDTVFYRWYPALALNEVGGEPNHFFTADQLHAAFADPLRTRPRALIATATHDTKRGEDARARLAMLTHPDVRWADELSQWQALCRPPIHDGFPNDKALLLILQTIYSVWPADKDSAAAIDDIGPRLHTYFLKAFREAKEQTSWLDPNENFERQIAGFVSRLLGCQAFVSRLDRFVKTHDAIARRISLGMTALKFCLPGIPDLYHGTELQDLSLVDPDNRRPVDIGRLLRELKSPSNTADAPNAKQHLIARLLSIRRKKPDLFAAGTYLPIEFADDCSPLFAFEKYHADDRMIVVVHRWPLYGEPQSVDACLQKLKSLLVGNAWHDVVSEREFGAGPDCSLKESLQHWSVAVLVREITTA